MLKRSISSLRVVDPHLPVHAFVFGRPPRAQVAGLRALDAVVHLRPKIHRQWATFLKWDALEEVDADSVLFLDADTYVARSLTVLFDKYSKPDICARQEIGTEKDEMVRCVGNYLIYPKVNWPLHERLAEAFGVRPLPFFNTGVMLLNNGVHRRIATRLHIIRSLARGFRLGKYPCPSNNKHIVEEVAASYALGHIPGLTYQFLAARDSPWYLEVAAGVYGPGVVMHTWTTFYPFFLWHLDGPSALEHSPFHGRIAPPESPLLVLR